MNDIALAYFEGMITKCAERGIDPEWLIKNAISPSQITKLKLRGKAKPSFLQTADERVAMKAPAAVKPKAGPAAGAVKYKTPQGILNARKTLRPPVVKPIVAPAAKAEAIQARIQKARGPVKLRDRRPLEEIEANRPRIRMRNRVDPDVAAVLQSEARGIPPPPVSSGGAIAAPTAATAAPGVAPTAVNPVQPVVPAAAPKAAPAAVKSEGPGTLATLAALGIGGYGTHRALQDAGGSWESSGLDTVARKARNALTGRPMETGWKSERELAREKEELAGDVPAVVSKN